jgi:hypothetical protein
MKRLFFLAVSIFGMTSFVTQSFGQSNTYTLSKVENGVECYYALADCNGMQVVLLKFNNRNTSPVTISWKSVFELEEEGTRKNEQSTERQLVLQPGLTSVSDCESSTNRDLIVHAPQHSPVYQPKTISSFGFTETRFVQNK